MRGVARRGRRLQLAQRARRELVAAQEFRLALAVGALVLALLRAQLAAAEVVHKLDLREPMRRQAGIIFADTVELCMQVPATCL